MSQPEHLWWAERWQWASRLCKERRNPYGGIIDIAEMNYTLFLTFTWSWYMDRCEKQRAMRSYIEKYEKGDTNE